MKSFIEFHDSLTKGEEVYIESLTKAKADANGNIKEFAKIASKLTGNTKPRLKTCKIFNKILEEIEQEKS